jgi:CMP-N,N'-diacetyllegionaminic acid synthase
MINGLNVLAIIPARGGSKGIPLKNLKKVGGVPIVELAARVASKVFYIDRIIVSTDHEGIAEAAKNGGADAPFWRPEELSGDKVSDLQVLTHALLEIEELDKKKYDLVVMLQPTSPLRTRQHILDSIEMLVGNNYDSVWTISETDSKCHPIKQLTISHGKLSYYAEKGKEIIARQQLSPVYHRNGIAYVISRNSIIHKKSIKGDNTGYVICQGVHVSIDTELDLSFVRWMVSNKNNKV